MKLTKEELDQRNRLKAVLKIKVIDRQSFAEIIGAKKGYVDQMLSGNRRVSDSAIFRLIKRYSDINPDWILTGEGKMLTEEKYEQPVPVKVEEPKLVYESALRVEDLGRVIAAMQQDIEALRAEVERLRAEVARPKE